jgi:hypothetical protein
VVHVYLEEGEEKAEYKGESGIYEHAYRDRTRHPDSEEEERFPYVELFESDQEEDQAGS